MNTKRDQPMLHDPHVPRFPVIYEEPTFQQVRSNISQADYIQSVIVGVACFPLGHIVVLLSPLLAHQLDRSLARRGMWFTGIIGTLGSAMLAYQNSTLRLQGFGRNEAELERHLHKIRDK